MATRDISYTPSGEIIATGVSEAEYLEKYAAHFCEWVNGTVIRMAPATFRHNSIIGYVGTLLEAYFELNPVSIVAYSPFLQRLTEIRVNREPDLMIVLDSNPNALTETALIGAADICIEVVSPESVARDRGEKFEEYEKGGVGEYWIFDYPRAEALFYRRNEEGIFIRQPEDADGNYQTPLLPGLSIHVATLWEQKLPGPGATARAVEAMLKR
jgi:Uma2 family endonuclease